VGKRTQCKDIHKEIFHVYGGKCLSPKAVHRWVEKRDRHFADDEEVEMEARKWLRQQSKDFHAAGFDALVKRWDRCINVGGGYVEKYFFFSFEYDTFYVLYPFVTYLRTLPRISVLTAAYI
jgi:hypothetical protein